MQRNTSPNIASNSRENSNASNKERCSVSRRSTTRLCRTRCCSKPNFLYGNNSEFGRIIETIRRYNWFYLIPAKEGRYIWFRHNLILLSPPARFGGLAVPIFHKIACFGYENSRKLTSPLSELIKEQSLVYSINDFQQKKLKNEIKTERPRRYKSTLTQLQSRTNGNEYRNTGKRNIKLANFIPN